MGGGTGREVKGEHCKGGGGRVGGGKVKGQLSLRPVGTLVVRERMGKAPEVQSGRALPMGRCANLPWGTTVRTGRQQSGLTLQMKIPTWQDLPRADTTKS